MNVKLLSLRKRFAALREGNICYVVLAGFSSLPTSVKEDVVILTNNLSGLMLHLQAKPTRVVGRYSLPISGHTKVDIGVVEKGKGLFPEQYETRLLTSSCHFREDVVRMPEPIGHAYATLYHQLFRCNLLGENLEQRTILKDLVRQRVGDFVAHEFSWLGNYNK